MIVWKDENKLLDTNLYKLNVGVSKFDDYRSSSEKIVKTESISFNDSYVYRTGAYQGYSTVIELSIRRFKLDEVIGHFYNGNRISLKEELNKFREYYIDGEIKYSYLGEYILVKIPVYFKAGIYALQEFNIKINKTITTNINNLGNMTAEPTYIIKGNGTLTFTVNGVVNKLKNSSKGYIVSCKSGKQNVYNLDGVPKNLTSEYSGVFPTLKVGNNKIQLIDGDSLEIKVNWRWK